MKKIPSDGKYFPTNQTEAVGVTDPKAHAMSLPLTDAQLEDRIVWVSLCHATNKSARQREKLWDDLLKLKRERDERRSGPFA